MCMFTGVPVCNRDADWRADAVCTVEGLKREGVQRFEEQDMGDEDDVKHLLVAGVEASGCAVDGT